MSIAIPSTTPDIDFGGIEPARLVLRPLLNLDDDQFLQLCAQNPEQSLEQNAQGEVQVMAPTRSGSSRRNNKILYQLTAWNESHLRGEVFESSTLFRFANGAARSADASWIEKSRWERLTEEEQESIALICPNFVIELRSKTDRLVDLQEKLVEYLANSVELGWIVDPLQCRVHIYTAGEPVQILDKPETVAGTGCMAGFVLELKGIFPAAD
jgi:Uma2 family endonuclease